MGEYQAPTTSAKLEVELDEYVITAMCSRVDPFVDCYLDKPTAMGYGFLVSSAAANRTAEDPPLAARQAERRVWARERAPAECLMPKVEDESSGQPAQGRHHAGAQRDVQHRSEVQTELAASTRPDPGKVFRRC